MLAVHVSIWLNPTVFAVVETINVVGDEDKRPLSFLHAFENGPPEPWQIFGRH